ncbi:protein TusC [Pasteurella dagmatis]|uniref:Sulfur relay protein TusC/DsrF n=2 Tax=Pasteurella dagmatis TaxID=754 RepID=C9PP13_9PAST|nr:sulfur relay protein TusC/DsrF [Pasteurella dagmatis ATCC 43325]SNV74844.1 protein TusC [Pasteurella dagmatis]
MMKLAFVFRGTPFGTSSSREGLDALLAATAFCDETDIGVFFLDDGVFNLLNSQNPEKILQKDIVSMLKLLDLYEIDQRYVCASSLETAQMTLQDCVISCKKIDRTALVSLLNRTEKVLTF